jgi:hypothetical protein
MYDNGPPGVGIGPSAGAAAGAVSGDAKFAMAWSLAAQRRPNSDRIAMITTIRPMR